MNRKGFFCFMVEPMGERSNFDADDLIKILEFIGLIEPYFDREEVY